MLTTGFNLLHLSLLEQFPLVCLFCLPLFASLFSVQFLPWHKGVKGVTYLGSLVQLCCGEGGTLQTNIAGVCVGSACSVWTRGPCCDLCQRVFCLGLPQLKAACASRVYTAQAPGCSARALSEVGPTFHTFPRSKSVRFLCTLQGHRHGLVCILHPSQLWAIQVTRCLASTLSWGTMHLNHLPGPSHSGCFMRAPSQLCHVSPLGSWSQGATLLADVNHPGSHEDMVSYWKHAHSLVEDAISGAETVAAPCLLALAVTCLPLGGWGEGACVQPPSSPLVFVQSIFLWMGQVNIRAFAGKFFFFFLSLVIPQFGLLTSH